MSILMAVLGFFYCKGGGGQCVEVKKYSSFDLNLSYFYFEGTCGCIYKNASLSLLVTLLTD